MAGRRAVLSSAEALLAHHPDIAWAADWYRLDGKKPPISIQQQVTRSDAIRWTATAYASQEKEFAELPPLRLRTDGAAYKSMMLKLEIPERYAFQREAISNMVELVDNERHLYSGKIVAPCGSGKTNIMLGLACEIRGPLLILAPKHETAAQIASVFESKRIPVRIIKPSTNSAVSDAPPAVTIATYEALANARAKDVGALTLEMAMVLHVWRYDALFLDEVHTVPAKTYEQACLRIRTGTRIGFTADLSRCDKKDADWIGPIRFELSNKTALAAGVIASMKSRVIVIPTTEAFRKCYEGATTDGKRTMAALNPSKIDELHRLLKSSAAKKVVVFVDKLDAVDPIEHELKKDSKRSFAGTLSGSTDTKTRIAILNTMREEVSTCISLFTRVGNASIDVPGIDLVIEMSVVDGSHQQKTQRDGRAQRVCEGKHGAEVVTLVSEGTHEVAFARIRSDGEVTWETAPTSGNASSTDTSPPLPSCPWTDADLPSMVGRKRARETD